MQETLLYIFMAGIPVAWIFSTVVTVWQERHRHKEILHALESQQSMIKELVADGVKVRCLIKNAKIASLNGL